MLDRMAAVARRRRLAPATIECYRSWVRRFFVFSRVDGRWRTPGELRAADVQAFLTHLAAERRLSASSQNQALNALVFLYRHVLEGAIPQDHLGKFVLLRSRRKKRIPTVLSAAKVALLLRSICGDKYQMMARLL